MSITESAIEIFLDRLPLEKHKTIIGIIQDGIKEKRCWTDILIDVRQFDEAFADSMFRLVMSQEKMK
jgi:hypothetical protein